MNLMHHIVELKAEAAARRGETRSPDPKSSSELPGGVALVPGLLSISFENEQQLLERPFLLARVPGTQPDVLSAVRPASAS